MNPFISNAKGVAGTVIVTVVLGGVMQGYAMLERIRSLENSLAAYEAIITEIRMRTRKNAESIINIDTRYDVLQPCISELCTRGYPQKPNDDHPH